MKRLLKRFLSAATASLPQGAREAILEGIFDSSGPWRAFDRLAPRCGIVTVGVCGAYGRILSSVADATVLREYARTGRWAHRTNELLQSFFAGRGGQYVDIGANIGLTTIPVAQNARVRCLALEPEPTNFANLAANVGTNCRHGNVDMRQMAVFSQRRVMRLELAPENLGDHRLRLDDRAGLLGEEEWPTVDVEAAPLDEIVPDPSRPLAVKIDTQGAEPFVFGGGSRTLAAADLIVTEWAPYWLAKLGGDPALVTDFLRQNFSEVSIAEGEDGALPPPEPVGDAVERLLEMAHRYKSDPLHYVDVIARR